jgi:hypothetical protein
MVSLNYYVNARRMSDLEQLPTQYTSPSKDGAIVNITGWFSWFAIVSVNNHKR